MLLHKWEWEVHGHIATVLIYHGCDQEDLSAGMSASAAFISKYHCL